MTILAWEEWDRARKALQWWEAWLSLWRSVGREVFAQAESQHVVQRMCDAREEVWWKAWAGVWPRMIQSTVEVWWIAWHRLWIDLGVEYMRPHRWTDRWLEAWEAIGNKYAADEVERARLGRYWRDQREVWWAAWIHMWKDIGQRESGAMAAWRPICRRCRDDLQPGHLCPRAGASAV